MNTETTETIERPRRRTGRPKKAISGILAFPPRTICIDDELLEAIDERAAGERISRSELMRKASHEYLRRAAKREGRVGE